MSKPPWTEVIQIRPTDNAVKARKFATLPIRRCYPFTKQVNCSLCGLLIKVGSMFRDQNTHERAHEVCVLQWTRED